MSDEIKNADSVDNNQGDEILFILNVVAAFSSSEKYL